VLRARVVAQCACAVKVCRSLPCGVGAGLAAFWIKGGKVCMREGGGKGKEGTRIKKEESP